MPVNLQPSQSLIESFLAGLNYKRQKEQDAAAAVEKQEEKKRYEEAFKRKTEVEDREWEALQALRQFDKSRAALEITKMTEVPPSPFQEIGRTGSIPIGEGYATTAGIYAEPGNPNQFQLLSQIDQARKQAEIARLVGAPEREFELNKLNEQAFLKALETMEQRKYQEDRDIATRTEQEKRDKRLHDYRMLEAKARAVGRINPLDRPIDYRSQMEFFGDYNPERTLGQASGGAKALTPVQQAELADLDKITDLARELKLSLEIDPNVARDDIDLAKILQNRNYFQGFMGLIPDVRAAASGGRKDKRADEISAAFANLNQQIALANFGKVIPSGEKEILKQMSPSPSQRQTVDSVLSKLEAIIDRNEKTKAARLGYAVDRIPKTLKETQENPLDLDTLRKSILNPKRP